MSVIKIIKNKNYSVMSNYHLRDKDLTLKAKGLMSLMLSLPENWDYSILGLTTLSKGGKDSVMNTLKELEERKYLVRIQKITLGGQFNGYEYELYEKPYTENPNTVKPIAENSTQINTKEINTKDNKENISKDIKEKYLTFGEFKRIKLTEAEYQRLIDEFDKDYIDKVIKALDEYVESNNNKNKYTNFNLVIRKAIREKWFVISTIKNNPIDLPNGGFDEL